MLALISIILVLLGTAYLYVKKQYNYWKDLGVPGPEPKFPYGTYNRTVSPVISITDYYQKYKGKSPFIGLINIISPAIIVTDLALIKNILVRDFQFFSTRGIYHNARDDPLSAHLFSIDGPKWKKLRSKLTPTFTSGKMKYMFETIVDVSKQFKKVLSETIDTQKGPIEMKDFLARFTTDVIGTCAFGVECNSLSDPDAKFRQMGLKFFQQPRHSIAGRILMGTMPNVARLLKIKVLPNDVSDFFLSAVSDTVQYRLKNNVKRNDFMDLLIKMYDENKTEEDQVDKLTFNELAAQAWVFFLAGFETSSSAMSYALYELSQNQVLQDKARKDITDALAKHNDTLTYEALQDMTYLEQCINESMRKYPPVPVLVRRVVKEYKEPLTNVIFREGQMVIIPAYSIHHDAEYYPEPEIYDPDRFLPNMNNRDPFVFLPFGEGPRVCIGLRFGMMQAKIGLATLLTKFRFKLNKKTPVPVTFTKTSIILATETGLYFDVEPLE